MTESTEVPSWIVWMWQYHSLSVLECPTREEAISLAVGIEDEGDGSLQCIEGPDGSLVPQADIDAYEEAKTEAYRERMAAEPKRTHRVEVESPSGRDVAVWGGYVGRDAAEDVAATLRARFGERVKVKAIQQP